MHSAALAPSSELQQAISARAPGWPIERTSCDWQHTALLSVEAGRLERWCRPGLILIGDAAHVMSPVDGVGINYAIQDAIVTSNIVGPERRQG
jgi:2-polyprenyl-6-methoxyphenol hydroxylase-like FAD-dependent oxidoreductase